MKIGSIVIRCYESEAEVERMVKLGACRYPWRYAPGSDFIVLEDPDGNLFCVIQVPGDQGLFSPHYRCRPLPAEVA
jgi:hypothetical protein